MALYLELLQKHTILQSKFSGQYYKMEMPILQNAVLCIYFQSKKNTYFVLAGPFDNGMLNEVPLIPG